MKNFLKKLVFLVLIFSSISSVHSATTATLSSVSVKVTNLVTSTETSYNNSQITSGVNSGPVRLARSGNNVSFNVVQDGRYSIQVTGIEQYTNKSSSQTFIAWRDTVPPTVDDITNSSSPILLATDSHQYSISISNNGGSPIVRVDGNTENVANQSTTPFSDTLAPWDQIWDISRVDNYRNQDNNTAREFTFTITDICDEAGNCASDNASWSGDSYNHNVYANASNITTTLGGTANLTGGNGIADGSVENLSLNLVDEYGNQIIPTSGINREINFSLTGDNHLAINQYEYDEINTPGMGDSAVYIDSSGFSLGGGATLDTANLSSTNGDYNIDVQLYTPTTNSMGNDSTLWNTGDFTLTDITANVTDSFGGGTGSITTSIAFNFKPLYYTSFNDIGIKQYGMRIDGGIQDSEMNVSENASATTTNHKVYLTYGTSDNSSGILGQLEMNFSDSSIPSTLMSESGIDNSSVYHAQNNSSAFVAGPLVLRTLLTSSDTIAEANSTYLGTHIGYSINTPIGNMDVVYNGEYIGSASVSINNTFNSGLKVIGSIHSQSQKNTITEQGDSLNSFGKLSKSILRADIKKKVFEIIKDAQISDSGVNYDPADLNITNTSGSEWSYDTTGTPVKKLSNNTVLYFGGLDGKKVTVGSNPNDTSSLPIDNLKTLIVVGGNIYLNDNMYYVPNTTSGLGLIALQDENGNGGNIYIDNNVTNIVGTIFAEGSLISYDGVNELSGETQQSDLANQLHIYGSVFSENTIGGSVNQDSVTGLYKCPFNIDQSYICNKDMAQKYDLNYLRRYQRYDHDDDPTTPAVPSHNGKVIGGFTCHNTTYICNYAGDPPTTLRSTDLEDEIVDLNGSSANKDYPVIIKYNQYLQIAPPPLFGN